MKKPQLGCGEKGNAEFRLIVKVGDKTRLERPKVQSLWNRPPQNSASNIKM